MINNLIKKRPKHLTFLSNISCFYIHLSNFSNVIIDSIEFKILNLSDSFRLFEFETVILCKYFLPLLFLYELLLHILLALVYIVGLITLFGWINGSSPRRLKTKELI